MSFYSYSSRFEYKVMAKLYNMFLVNLEERLEKRMEGFVKMVDSVNLEERLEKNMERIAKLIQNLERKIPKSDDVAQGSEENKYNVHVDQPSKHTSRGFDSNNGSNKGWSPRGIQLPKIDMRKFYGKDPVDTQTV